MSALRPRALNNLTSQKQFLPICLNCQSRVKQAAGKYSSDAMLTRNKHFDGVLDKIKGFTEHTVFLRLNLSLNIIIKPKYFHTLPNEFQLCLDGNNTISVEGYAGQRNWAMRLNYGLCQQETMFFFYYINIIFVPLCQIQYQNWSN